MPDEQELKDALECTIEHLDGEHEGKCVVETDVFNALHEAAQKYAELLPLLEGLVEARDSATEYEWFAAGNTLRGGRALDGYEYLLGALDFTDDMNFVTTAANTVPKIKQIIGGG